MSALGMNAIYIPVARLEFLSFNELSRSIYEQSLSHGNYFCSACRGAGAAPALVGWMGQGLQEPRRAAQTERNGGCFGGWFSRPSLKISIVVQLSVGKKLCHLSEGGPPRPPPSAEGLRRAGFQGER